MKSRCDHSVYRGLAKRFPAILKGRDYNSPVALTLGQTFAGLKRPVAEMPGNGFQESLVSHGKAT
jgi:hypothetical protein